MKTLLNVLRAIAFTVIICYLIPYLYVGLGWLSLKTMLAINYLHSHFTFFVFWLILIIVVASLFRLVWGIFKAIAIVLMRIANKICPYEAYATWSIIVVSIISFLFFEYGYWKTNGWPSLTDGIAGIIITFLGIGLLGAIFRGTQLAWYGNDISIDYDNV